MNAFTSQALIFIASAVMLVPLFQKLGFGSVLGYLISGVIVGPYGLKLIQDSDSIMHFSEFGVVFLLFIIGLEIQPRKLWSMRRHLFGFGLFQILATTFVISAATFKFCDVTLISAIVIGFALSLSSTAFAVQTLTEKNQFNTEFGRASFSILLMQDLLAIPALAIIPTLAISTAADVVAIDYTKAVYALFTIGFLIVTSRYLIRPAFRFIASTRSREVFTAVALLIVLGVSALMQKVGLSAALGTFIAGVLLADSEYRHELETNIEPFKGLLMGLFFIAVGMGVSLDLILQEPVLLFGLALGYLLIKAFILYGIGRFLKMNHQNSKMMALAIAQGGEFAFVIFGLMSTLGLVESKIISSLTVVITASMALNPILSILNEKLTRIRHVKPEYDQIKGEKPEVIIAGFGRFGQTFGRILRAQNIAYVAVDHDSNQIELVRKFGNYVYYGDASRKELLETAGASQAKYFILAIDDVELSLKTAQMVKENFPHLKIFARARNRGHAYELMELGIKYIKRELFDSSVNFSMDLLIEMGIAAEKAERMVDRFRIHDEVMLREQFKVRQDDKSLISISQQGMAQLGQVLNDDNRQTHIEIKSNI